MASIEFNPVYGRRIVKRLSDPTTVITINPDSLKESIDALKLSANRKGFVYEWLDHLKAAKREERRLSSRYSFGKRIPLFSGAIIFCLAASIVAISSSEWASTSVAGPLRVISIVLIAVIGFLAFMSEAVVDKSQIFQQTLQARWQVWMLDSVGQSFILLSGRYEQFETHEAAFEQFLDDVQTITQV
jgi:hypothetical protein